MKLQAGRIGKLLLLAGAVALLPTLPLWGGSTGQTSLYMPQGSLATTANGDYILDTGGLNSYYAYFVEVPSGLSRLVIELFDADVSNAAGQQDRQRGGDLDADFQYTLLNPSGATIATFDNTDGIDNAWFEVLDTNDTPFPPTVAPAFESQAGANKGNAGTSLSIVAPAGIDVGDFLVAVVARGDDGGNLTPATGWTELDDGNCANSGGDGGCRMAIFYKVAVGDEDAVAQSFGLGQPDEAAGSILVYTGVDLANPFNGGTDTNTGTGTSAVAQDIVTTVANTRVVRAFAAGGSSVTIGTPTNGNGTAIAILDTEANADATGVQESVFDQTLATAGSTGDSTSTLSTSSPWRTITFALRGLPGPIPNGHYEIRVDSSSGDDLNAIGVRAHDGTAGAGGTELPIYYDSHTQFGVNPVSNPSSRDYDVFPWVTNGCQGVVSTFDFDANNGGSQGSVGLTSPVSVPGGTSYTLTIADGALSGNNVWLRNTFGPWTTDTRSTRYGIWRADVNIQTYTTPALNGNYTNVYFAPSTQPADPPSQPEVGAFRVYLPSDVSDTTAPVKPYLEQLLTHIAGPNPPAVGVQSTFRVTVRLVNPTAQSITFSSPTNIVTANVPGSGAVYGGDDLVSQGSVLSEPAVGGTGNVTWNPGTVTAGTTALLAYRVLITPTVAGQRVVATGTPALNGTRAQYVDETGNTSQDRATYLQGPLCELAITQGLLTKALVTDLQAVAERGGQVAVEWATTTEDGTVGFDLYRWSAKADDWVLVNAEPVMAAPDSVQGARYRVIDSGASPGEELSYSLIEFESRGGSREAGRFTVVAGERRGDAAAFRGELAAERLATPAPGLELARLAADAERRNAVARLDTARLPAPTAGGRFKAIVRERGLYRITVAELRSYLGLTSERLALSYLQSGQFRVENRGLPVAWSRANVGGTHALYFFGEEANSIHTDDNVYWVSVGAGPRMQSAEVGAGADGETTFVDRLDVETGVFAATVVSSDPESDYWYWTYLVGDSGSDGARDLPFVLVDAVTAGDASLTVRFKGATATGVADEHEAELFVNGIAIGTTSWTGITDHSATFEFSASILQPGANTLRVEAFAGPGAPWSVYYVDGFEVASPRLLQAATGQLELTGGDAATVEVSGFAPSSFLRLFDLSDPRSPRIVSGAAIAPAGTSLRFDPESPATPYLAAALGSAMAPAELRVDTPSNLRAAKGAEYVVVSDDDLATGAAQFAAYRGAQGLTALAVRLEDVYDEFSFGMATPQALRDFAAWAATEWSAPLRYLVLAGDGHLDSRNLLGLGGNRIPVRMIATPSGLFASDSAFGDFDDDGVPEIAVGRLPALSNAELAALLAKTQAHESLTGDWADRVTLVADDADGAASFIADSDQVEGLLGEGYEVSKIYLGPLSTSEAHDALVAAIQAGAGHVHYFGHGGLDRFADESILSNADVAALGNAGRAPFLTALSCAINRFELPAFPALGEELVRRADGGAAAVFAPSGLGHHGAAAEFSSRLAIVVYGGGPERVGDAVVEAQAAFAGAGGDRELLRLYTLIGDPALKLRRPAAPEPGPGSPGNE